MLSFPNTTNVGGKFNDLYDDRGNRVYQTDSRLSEFDVSKIKSFNMNLNATIKKELLDDTSLDISLNNYRIRPSKILSKNFTVFSGEPVETVTSSGDSTNDNASKDSEYLTTNENPFAIPASILTTVNRYNRIYTTPVNNLMNAGQENTEVPEQDSSNASGDSEAEKKKEAEGNNNNNEQNKTDQASNAASEKKTTQNTNPVEITGLKTKVVSSIFNPTHMIQVSGLLDNVPLMNMQSSYQSEWVSLSESAYNMGLTGGDYVERPVTYSSWELDLDKDGKVKTGRWQGWEYDTSTGLLFKNEVVEEKTDKNTASGSTTAAGGNAGTQTQTSTTTSGTTPTKATTKAAGKGKGKTNKGKGKGKGSSAKTSTETKKTTKRVYATDRVDVSKEMQDQMGAGNWRINDNGSVDIKINYNPFDTNLIDNSANCTIRELVRMSHTPNGQLGMSKFKYADFLFCKNVGKVSNNHMITLRRFAHPVGDNIFRFSGKGYLNTQKPGYHGHQENAGMGTLITWFGTDDNKLEDILSYSVKSSWKEFKSKIQEIESQEDNPAGGLIGMFANSFNPGYNSLVAKGMAGSNSLWNKMGSSIFGGVIGKAYGMVGGSNPGTGGTNANSMKKWDLMRMDSDKNKIYTPQNTIQATHKYEGELTLQHEFTLNFSYCLRALDVMNPKTVMLDLIGNILEVTYNRGHFWGGSRRFIGPPRNASGIAKANAFIDKQWTKLEGFMMGFANGTLDWKGILSSLSDAVSNAVSAIKGAAEGKGGYANLFMDGARKLAGKFISAGASRAMLGQLKNQLGRPAVYAMDSLLDGSPVGLWHVTIGNPKNPIAAFGNLIMTNAKITHSGPLGFDDFPTELKVSCTLKHGRSRDLSEVARMYTKGSGAFYNALDKNKLSEFFTVSNTSTGKQVETEMMMANYARGLVEQLDAVDAEVAACDARIKAAEDKIKAAQDAQAEAAKQKKEKKDADSKNSSDNKQTEKKSQENENKDKPASTKKGGDTKKDEKKDPKDGTNKTDNKSSDNKSSGDTQETEEDKKIKESKEAEAAAKEELSKARQDKQKALQKRETAMKELKDENIQKYLGDNYSSIYGDMSSQDKIDAMRNSNLALYEDTASKKNADYYRRGHFIRDEWALRYETLGQDLDTEGRILIDENA